LANPLPSWNHRHCNRRRFLPGMIRRLLHENKITPRAAAATIAFLHSFLLG
jgi:hypothetical protein